ncbi:MAG: phosphoserine phosphatase SerB [Candidatus Heimdallarchaeota archaeon]|nr:phosphoserine phosphatase SerB [Candidatus Heimdallarchaeota archaeon]
MNKSEIDNKSNLMILQINGGDKPGLFTQICSYLFDLNINILDISQNVMRGYLSITFLLDVTQAVVNKDRLDLGIQKLCKSINLNGSLYNYEEGSRSKIRNLYVFTIMGENISGILAKISNILNLHKVNIDTIKTQVRGGWVYNQFILDLTNTPDIKAMRNQLRFQCDELNLSMVLQYEKTYRKNKRLIAFDMDSTLVKGETIVKIAERVNKFKEMEEKTNLAMSTNIDFETSLRQRAQLIKGIKIEVLHEIANDLEITAGAEELIHHLKDMGWKIALISSGFSIFTDVVKERLGIDYSFGNTLEIIDGLATGNVLGTIIDGKGKWDILTDLIDNLNITSDEVVTVGDGSNDMVMLQQSGLGIGLNSKEIASEVADGKVKETDVSNILLMLGLSDSEIESIIHKS